MTGGSSVGDRARSNKWDQKEYEGLKEKYEGLVRERSGIGPCSQRESDLAALRPCPLLAARVEHKLLNSPLFESCESLPRQDSQRGGT